jgi:hypothetical protein
MEQDWSWSDYETLLESLKQTHHAFVEIYVFPTGVKLPMEFLTKAKKYLAKPLAPVAVMVCGDRLTHGMVEMLKTFGELKRYPHRLIVTHDEGKGYEIAQAWLAEQPR